MAILIILASAAWIGLWLLPWRPWSTREQLEPRSDPSSREPPGEGTGPTSCRPGPPTRRSRFTAPLCEGESAALSPDLSDVTVLIPARNEAGVIGRTLRALRHQGPGLRVIVIDDQSSDSTADEARAAFDESLTVLHGAPLPEGWAGKLWTLEQGRREAQSPLLLLLDADIELAPGMVAALRQKLVDERLDLVSIMATLRMETFWEKLLVPAFIYFFKLLFPFALGNSPRSRLGVAAGGCILIRAQALERIGGFGSIRGALIDDCALAQKVKSAGCRTWTGLSHAVRSHRAYAGLSSLWNMVARSAFTQLRYSTTLLLATTAAMVLVFWFPWLGLFTASPWIQVVAATGLVAMLGAYLPTVRYYRRSPSWALALPFIGTLYLLMTWTSALRYWRGQRSMWKGRVYSPSK
jgi:hopene-associated glycosyltransferase HpnB